MSNQPFTSSSQTHLTNNAALIVIILLLVDSLHFVFARLLLPHLPPVTSAMYVLAIATVEIAILARLQGPYRFGTFQRNVWFFLAIGFLVAASTNLNYASVAFIDPGTAALLAKAAVLFGLGFGLLWLRERLTGFQAAGALITIIGVFVITFQSGDYLRVGTLMILASTFMYALHAALVKRYGERLSMTEFFLFRLMSTTGFLFVFALGGGHLVWPRGQAWLILMMVGTVDVVISRGLYYLALRRLNMSLHSLVLTISPVVAIGWSLFLFGTSPTPPQLVGGLAVLLGVFMVTIKK